MSNKRITWILVGGSLFALTTFVVMWWLSHQFGTSFDFIIPWAAFWGVAGGVSSWMYANFARVSDSRREKLAEIMEKTLQVHRAIESISSFASFEEEFDQAIEKYSIRNTMHEDRYRRQGIIFAYRYEQFNELFLEYRVFQNESYLYFGEEVSNIIKDLRGIIDSVKIDIIKIRGLSENDPETTQEFNSELSNMVDSIWALSTGEVVEIGSNEATKERLRVFKSIPGRIDKVLSKYALKK